MSQEKLKPVFIPALSAVLLSSEDKKGEPLTNEEVVSLRDNATTIMMKIEDAEKLYESRGYKDIDPENCWYDWQMLRREMGRKPDLDPGARFNYVDSTKDDFQKTIETAQETLSSFKNWFKYERFSQIFPLVKVLLEDDNYRAYIWVRALEIENENFLCEIFELPSEYEDFGVGDILELEQSEIQDWMVNDGGVLYGGYSLRYSREKMSLEEQAKFDEHLGVEKYA